MSTAVAQSVETSPAFEITKDPERWILPTTIAAITAIVLGGIWDISWHMSIGRDSLFSPPHVLQQLGATTAGLVCGAYVLWLTFRAPALARARTVRVWGFHGPLGAWLCVWGSLAMLASVAFDNWWHNAYGLDVQILSPPHAVLMLGIIGIEWGVLLFALAAWNRAGESTKRAYGWAFSYAMGILIVMGALAFYEFIAYANEWHRSGFYKITAILFPFMLAGIARAAPLRWSASTAAATYMLLILASSWILQLVPAEPKLAPIYNRIDHMVPLAFPLVLVAPALLIDLLERRLFHNDWIRAAVMAVAFVGVMLIVHWPFGEFMLSPAARNFFFAADQWPYMYEPSAWRHEFWRLDRAADGSWSAGLFLQGALLALAIAFLSARVGLVWGKWTRTVLR